MSDFTTDARMFGIAALALVTGAFSSVLAFVLVWLINAVTNVAYFGRLSSAAVLPADHHLGYWAIPVPMVGGLIIGLMARFGTEKIRGHGIPEALEAIVIGQSRIGPKVALLKPISSAISIGTGGPFGAEGPIIMTGGAFGSLFAQFFHLSSTERRTLLAAGAAGGMAAIFATPFAAALLAVELLLFEWKPRSFIPVVLAASVASVLRVPLLGAGPIFPVPPHAPVGLEGLVFALLVGLAAGGLSGVVTNLVYGFEGLFERLPIHWMWWPAIGGLGVGLVGAVDPRVLGVGYGLIHGLLRGEIIGAALVGLLVSKSVVWSCALGSGTSGGVLAPLLMIGGALGAIAAQWIPIGDSSLWAMVGMAAMMGGTMRTPFAATVFLVEVTHDLNALPAVLVGCIGAVAVTVLLMRRSILTEKVARRGHHIAYEYDVDPLATQRVGDVMDAAPVSIRAEMTVAELSGAIVRGDATVADRQGVLIVDGTGALVGIITRSDIFQSLEADPTGTLTVLDAGSRRLIVTYPDESLKAAVAKMIEHGIGRLPVVSRADASVLLGYFGRSGLLRARMRTLQDEELRERRWSIPGTARR